jgi:hypothetical protein
MASLLVRVLIQLVGGRHSCERSCNPDTEESVHISEATLYISGVQLHARNYILGERKDGLIEKKCLRRGVPLCVWASSTCVFWRE